MRCFRVVSVLSPQDFTNCFSVGGALKRPHKGEKYRSLNAAMRGAQQWDDAGWYTSVVRRTRRNGWVRVGWA